MLLWRQQLGVGDGADRRAHVVHDRDGHQDRRELLDGQLACCPLIGVAIGLVCLDVLALEPEDVRVGRETAQILGEHHPLDLGLVRSEEGDRGGDVDVVAVLLNTGRDGHDP
jgi:hypothetical protein